MVITSHLSSTRYIQSDLVSPTFSSSPHSGFDLTVENSLIVWLYVLFGHQSKTFTDIFSQL